MNKNLAILSFFIFSVFHLNAQNLEKIGQKDMLQVSGGVNFNSIVYASSGVPIPSREPFAWYASGNLTFNFLDVALPFTYTYSNQGGKYTQPFNRTALHPTYKWAKAHLGLVSMNFSPYTLNGHLFLGGGLELTPKKWNISFMAGRLLKDVQYDPIEDNVDQIAYRRFGYGLKVGHQTKKTEFEFIALKAKDNVNSLEVIPLNSSIKPQDNIVLSGKAKFNITKSLSVEGEYAQSAITNNLLETSDELAISQKSSLNYFIETNSSTGHYQAYKAAVKYGMKWFNVGFNFEHIDPGYKTLGGYFFNNDLENYTLNPSFTFFKQKLNIAVNTGFQRNNLNDANSGTTKRWVGSVNLSVVPSSNLIFNGTYSNFTTYTRNRPLTDPFYYPMADTMNFFQLTQNGSAMISWSFGKNSNKNTLQLMYNYQESNSATGAAEELGIFNPNQSQNASFAPTKVHVSNLSFSKPLVGIDGAFVTGANATFSQIPGQESLYFGPSLNFKKSLFKKRSSLVIGTTYNKRMINGEQSSDIINNRLGFNLSPKSNSDSFGQFSLSANANYLIGISNIAGEANRHELNFFLNLSYRFR